MSEQEFEVAGEDKVDYEALGLGLPDAESEPDAPENEEEAVEDTAPSSEQPHYEEDVQEEAEPSWDESDEQVARKFGWKPRTEWKGDIPPTFVDDPREFLSSKTRVLDEYTTLKEQLEATRRELVQLSKGQESQLESQRSQRISQLEQERDKAFDLGDKKRFAELDAEIREMERQPQREAQPEIDPVVERATQSNVYQEWLQSNPWYTGQSFEDAAKQAYANQVGPALLQQMNLSYEQVMANPTTERQFYDAVAKEVNRAYGGSQNPMRDKQVPNTPSHSGRQPATQRRGKNDQSFDKLPSEAKVAFDRLARKKIYANDDKGRAEYARDFHAQ